MTELPSLDEFRPYLQTLARIQLAQGVRARLDASDIVQQTMLQAHQAWDSFRGASDQELTAWLRQILARNLAHALRDHQRDRRDVRREQSLQDSLAKSSARMIDLLCAGDTGPDQRVERAERLLELADALGRMLPDQRTAIELHYLQELSVHDVASNMDRSVAAVGGLLHRGLKSLRAILGCGSDS